MSYWNVTQSLEATRFEFRIVWSLWNFDRHLGNSTAEEPVKFQSDAIIQTSNVAALRRHEILRQSVSSDVWTELFWPDSTTPMIAANGFVLNPNATPDTDFSLSI